MRYKDIIKGNIAYHKELCPKVWSDDHLRLEVRYKLLEIAHRFINYLDVPTFKLKDVLLRGSLTNYNYTNYSDYDLHLVTDFSTLECQDLAEKFYQAKKKIWNDEHDITIHGHEVELYVENLRDENVSPGVYSVLDDQWIKRPSYDPPAINDRAVNSKVKDLMGIINSALNGDAEDVQRVREKISIMRKSGLAKGGEYSVENLVFKILRNQGYLDKLAKTFNTKQDQELSLNERKKKRKAKNKKYPVGAYWGYYYGGGDINSDGGDGGGESLSEGWKSNAVMAALISALSLPASADYNYPNTQQKEINPAGQALIIYRKLYNMQKYGQAGLEAEAKQELHNILQSIQGHPNQSRILPIVKDIINTPNEQPLPPLQEPVNESSAQLDPEVEEFLDGLTPDDVGYDEVGDYIVHYEGFTDQCQDSEEYQDDPEAVFNDVWGDFKRRMGDRDPVNYGIVGEHDYPIVYSVFRR
jgi:hypothetical protein